MRKFIALEAFPNLLANLGTYYRNLDDKLSSFRAFGNFSNNGEVLGLNLQDLPLMLINGGYKTLDELKRAKYKISIYFRKDENFKGECLNVDIEDISIFTLALSHNFDVVLSMQNFNGYKIKDTYFFEPTKINFSNFISHYFN